MSESGWVPVCVCVCVCVCMRIRASVCDCVDEGEVLQGLSDQPPAQQPKRTQACDGERAAPSESGDSSVNLGLSDQPFQKRLHMKTHVTL